MSMLSRVRSGHAAFLLDNYRNPSLLLMNHGAWEELRSDLAALWPYPCPPSYITSFMGMRVLRSSDVKAEEAFVVGAV